VSQAIGGWGGYALAFLVFALAHALPARPRLRQPLVEALGERAYLWGYSLVSLGLLYWLIIAAGRAPFLPLWDFRPWQLWVPNLVMPLVVLLATAGIGAANPFSFGGDPDRPFDPDRPGIVGLTRHPLLLAIVLWAAAHVVPNGNLAHALLFGLFAAMGVLGMVMLDRRRRRQWGPRRFAELARGTSALPGAAWLGGRSAPDRSVLSGRRLLAALAAYLAIMVLHPTLFGVSPLPPH